jgi:DNA-binding NarL/FixJ family response regulator
VNFEVLDENFSGSYHPRIAYHEMVTDGPVKIILADDHPLFRSGLRNFLERDSQIQVVSEAVASDDAVQKAIEFNPDVILMDISMPGIGGIAAARKIKGERPKIGIVMLCASNDEHQILSAIEAGASGYITKDEAPDTICEAIHTVSEGNAFLPPAIAKQLLNRVSNSTLSKGRDYKDGSRSLTPQENVILRLMAEGHRNRAIAAQLGISERTVGNHINNIYSKLGISDRAQAIRYAIRTGVIRI